MFCQYFHNFDKTAPVFPPKGLIVLSLVQTTYTPLLRIETKIKMDTLGILGRVAANLFLERYIKRNTIYLERRSNKIGIE